MSKYPVACLFMKYKGNSWPASPDRIIVSSSLLPSVGSPSFPPCFLFEVLSGFELPVMAGSTRKWIPTALHDVSANTCQVTLAGQRSLAGSVCARLWCRAQVWRAQLGGRGLSCKDRSCFKGCTWSPPSPRTLKVFASVPWSSWWQSRTGDLSVALTN